MYISIIIHFSSKDLQQLHIKNWLLFFILEMLIQTEAVSALLVKSKRNLKITIPELNIPATFTGP